MLPVELYCIKIQYYRAMSLPDFTPLPTNELRELWRAHRGNADVRRLILEIQHGREVLRLIEELRIALDRVAGLHVPRSAE